MESKHTKGIVKFNEYGKIITIENQTILTSGVSITGRGNEEVEANAQLIADAFNVTNETNKTPRELQKSHAELLEALKAITRECCNDNSSHEIIWRIAEQAIETAKP